MGIIGSLMAFVTFHMQFGIESGLKLLIAPLAVLLLTTTSSGFSSEVSPCAFFAFRHSMDIGSYACVFIYSRAPVCHPLSVRDFSKYRIEMGMHRISRRDFLKTSAALVASATFAGASRILSSADSQAVTKPNILVFVFDAMSAQNLSLYGYGRRTTPNLEKFAERASVYHRHYSAGNFTTSGTASMLTGLYPWTHRAINYRGHGGPISGRSKFLQPHWQGIYACCIYSKLMGRYPFKSI